MENSNSKSVVFNESEMWVLNARVIVLRHDCGTFYLIGTFHNREESAEAVKRLIRIARPHIVAVELCRSSLERFSVTNINTQVQGQYSNQTTVMDFVPQRLKERAIGEQLLLGLIVESIKHETYCVNREKAKRFAMKNPHARNFTVKPKVFNNILIGKEMIVPFGEHSWTLQTLNSQYLVNPNYYYKIMLVDRPIEKTFCSIASALSAEEKNIIKVYQRNFLRIFISFGNSKSLIISMMEKNSKLHDAIVKERDQYIARSLRKALQEVRTKSKDKARVIGILGNNHIQGVIKYLYKIFHKEKTWTKKCNLKK